MPKYHLCWQGRQGSAKNISKQKGSEAQKFGNRWPTPYLSVTYGREDEFNDEELRIDGFCLPLIVFEVWTGTDG